MCAAAHAVVARICRMMFVERPGVRYVAARRWHEVAGKHLHGCKQHEEDCGEAERLGPKTHLPMMPYVGVIV